MESFFLSLGVFTPVSILIILGLAIGLHVRWNRRVAASGPALLTTFGIFFCFAGITSGLVDFDAADIRDSVPHLLQGIRTSFWASVFGIGCALTIKLRVLFFGEPRLQASGAATGATIDDLVTQLRKLDVSIAGTDGGTLIAEIRDSKGDSNQRLERLHGSIDRFVDANTKSLIAALSVVIRDFNTKIDDQFGQNFKELNTAMGRLLIWQQRYERQLNDLIDQETATRQNLAQVSVHFTGLVERAQVLLSTPDWLRQLLLQTNAQSERLNASLRNLAEVVTSQIEQGARVSHDTLSAVVMASTQAVETRNQELSDLLKTSGMAGTGDRVRKAK